MFVRLPSLGLRLATALVSGAVAIALNEAALMAADALGIATANGGLLRLVRRLMGDHDILPNGPGFQVSFHVLVGLGMAVFYGFAIAPFVQARHVRAGIAYGLAVWLLNALVLLPATHEGIAGSTHLTFVGMVWFAAAHMIFFIVQAVLFGALFPRKI